MRAGDLLRQLDGRVLPRLAQVITEVGQGPLRLRVLSWTAVLSVAVVLSTTVWVMDRQPLGGDRTVGEVARVGVAQGESIPRYVETARGELAALASPGVPAAETYALVTLAKYLPPDRLVPTLGEAPVAEVFGRVPLPDVQTQIIRIPAQRVPDDVVAGMVEVARRKDREARDYTARGAAVRGNDASQRDLRAFYETSARIAAAEAAAYRSGCTCLYAAVVRATPQVLRRVAGRPEVRAVDPAPEVTRLDRAVFTPPLPEQTDVVRPPSDSALPGSVGASPDGSPTGTRPAAETTPPDASPDLSSTPPTASPTEETALPTTGPTGTDSATPLGPPSASGATLEPSPVRSGSGP